MKNTEAIEKLSKLADDLPVEEIPGLQTALAGVSLKLAIRQMSETNHKQESADNDVDRLIDIKEVAKILSCSTDRLYRHPAELKSLEVPLGKRGVRYSKKAIQQFIARKTGR